MDHEDERNGGFHRSSIEIRGKKSKSKSKSNIIIRYSTRTVLHANLLVQFYPRRRLAGLPYSPSYGMFLRARRDGRTFW